MVAKKGTLLTKKRSPDRVTYLLADRGCGGIVATYTDTTSEREF